MKKVLLLLTVLVFSSFAQVSANELSLKKEKLITKGYVASTQEMVLTTNQEISFEIKDFAKHNFSFSEQSGKPVFVKENEFVPNQYWCRNYIPNRSKLSMSYQRDSNKVYPERLISV